MKRRPQCVVIKHLLGRCFRCGEMTDGTHLLDDPLRLYCGRCCVECGPTPDAGVAYPYDEPPQAREAAQRAGVS